MRKQCFCVKGIKVWGEFKKPWKKWYPLSHRKNNVYWLNSENGAIGFYQRDRLVLSGGEKGRCNFVSYYFYKKYLNNKKIHDPNLEHVQQKRK